MKKLLLIAAASLAIVGFAGIAFAGDYHVGATLVCGDCHVMHGVHDGSAATTTGHAALLKGADVNEACLTCHDGQAWAPDVIGPTAYAPNHGRLAGTLNAE